VSCSVKPCDEHTAPSTRDCSLVGEVSLDDVKFGFYHFVLAVLFALTTTRDGLFNNNAQSYGLASASVGVITNLT